MSSSVRRIPEIRLNDEMFNTDGVSNIANPSQSGSRSLFQPPRQPLDPRARIHSHSTNMTISRSQHSLTNSLSSADRQQAQSELPVNQVEWRNQFNMRTVNLGNLYAVCSSTNGRSHQRSQSAAATRYRNAIIQDPQETLEILRRILQPTINREIQIIVNKFKDTFFKRATANILASGHMKAPDEEEQLNTICRAILEEAKTLFPVESKDSNLSATTGNSEDGKGSKSPCSRSQSPSPAKKSKIESANKISDDKNLSDKHSLMESKVSKSAKDKRSKKRKRAGRLTPSKLNQERCIANTVRDGAAWNSSRIHEDTLFVLGSKANSALGYGATRGRLYTKHPTLFRYVGDADDKVWLHERNLMPPTGGKAYLCIKDDIERLIQSDEYVNEANVDASVMGDGFKVPEFMIIKMRSLMDAMKNSSGPRQKVECRMKGVLPKLGPSNAMTDDSRSATSSPAPSCSTNTNMGSNMLDIPEADDDGDSDSDFTSPLAADEEMTSQSTSLAGSSSPPDLYSHNSEMDTDNQK